MTELSNETKNRKVGRITKEPLYNIFKPMEQEHYLKSDIQVHIAQIYQDY